MYRVGFMVMRVCSPWCWLSAGNIGSPRAMPRCVHKMVSARFSRPGGFVEGAAAPEKDLRRGGPSPREAEHARADRSAPEEGRYGPGGGQRPESPEPPRFQGHPGRAQREALPHRRGREGDG